MTSPLNNNNGVGWSDVIGIVFLSVMIALMISLFITRHVYCADHKLSGIECEDAYKALSKDGLKP